MTARVYVLADYRRQAPEPLRSGNPFTAVWIALGASAAFVLIVSAAWYAAGAGPL